MVTPDVASSSVDCEFAAVDVEDPETLVNVAVDFGNPKELSKVKLVFCGNKSKGFALWLDRREQGGFG